MALRQATLSAMGSPVATTLCAVDAGGRKLAFCDAAGVPLWLPVLFEPPVPVELPVLFESEEPEPPPHAASTATVKAVKAERRMDGNTADDCFKPDLVMFVDA
ncbi:hypothetical protein BG57_31795 [Caballeronia grimmiae]|uniref:Uncharacterized protein n=1 Tax=Caballeronia grimmiae TaxID=1071679 RepID=A0A069NA46_9BURK|nr:hypothetical protein BG57_31795 [Caballeronia grimmiae]GGD98333.1 hypothetical protein GCM10010985_61370 [Caballeronia grimmiae]